MIEFGIAVHTSRLYNGRRSFYGNLKIWRRTFWIQRWDAARTTHDPKARRIIEPGGVMTWGWGAR